jgi:DivIVA domain-containing protein
LHRAHPSVASTAPSLEEAFPMSATELDLPVLITSEQIRRREFVTTRRGYDPDQVRDYLEGLAEQVDLMATMIRDARMEADALLRTDAEPKADPYERLARRVSGVIKAADDAAERFRMEARRDAERLMTEARDDAERIRTEAKAAAEEARQHADRALEEARQQADATIAGLSTRRDAVVEQLAEMRERLLGVANDLEATIIEPPPAPAEEHPPPAPAEEHAGAPAVARPETPDAAEPETHSAAAMNGNGWSPPPMPTNGRVIDVRSFADALGSPDAADVSIEALFADLEEGSRQDELWEGPDAVDQLEVPEIPSLDLDWGPDLDEDDLR